MRSEREAGMSAWEVVVVGLGATGAATVMELARRGVPVLGIDANRPPHTLGSHHGESRIIRKAYYEDPGYVPLLERAYALWRELERRSGQALMLPTGGLMIGSPSTELVSGVLASAREHRLAHEVLDASRMADRYPMFRLGRDMLGVFEPDAGILFPERCVSAFLDEARTAGADLRFGAPVRAWRSDPHGVTVTTDDGVIRAGTLVLAAGGGLPDLSPRLARHLAVERQVVVHVAAASNPEWFRPDRMPIFCLQEDDTSFFYGIPDLGGGLKSGQHHAGPTSTLASIDRVVHQADLDRVRTYLARRMPAANGSIASSTVCLYTNTPDAHFLVDRMPGEERVVVASACSGHGFKFATVLGEMVADLALGRPASPHCAMFSADRLGSIG